MSTVASSLVSLLGETRAALVESIRSEGSCTTAALAQRLDVSDVAVRKHLAQLVEDGLVVGENVPNGRGRPATHWRLTERGHRLWPDARADVAEDLLDFLEDEHGREGLRAFLRWRLDRQVEELAEQVDATEVDQRLDQLAGALVQAGFAARVDVAGSRFELTQSACALGDLPTEHPELCSYEAAAFARVLGTEVQVSRQATMASGAQACVCCVSVKDTPAPNARTPLPLAPTGLPGSTDHATDSRTTSPNAERP